MDSFGVDCICITNFVCGTAAERLLGVSAGLLGEFGSGRVLGVAGRSCGAFCMFFVNDVAGSRCGAELGTEDLFGSGKQGEL